MPSKEAMNAAEATIRRINVPIVAPPTIQELAQIIDDHMQVPKALCCDPKYHEGKHKSWCVLANFSK